MTRATGRKRTILILGSLLVGALCFVAALYSTGAGHGSYWAVILFYPLQFLGAAVLHEVADGAGSDSVFVVVAAVLSLPWFPLLTYLFSSAKRDLRIGGIALLVIHGVAALILLLTI